MHFYSGGRKPNLEFSGNLRYFRNAQMKFAGIALACDAVIYYANSRNALANRDILVPASVVLVLALLSIAQAGLVQRQINRSEKKKINSSQT